MVLNIIEEIVAGSLGGSIKVKWPALDLLNGFNFGRNKNVFIFVSLFSPAITIFKHSLNLISMSFDDITL